MSVSEPGPAIPTTLIVILIGSTLITFGYLKAVADRANSDYKKTKAGLPLMRKAFWSAFWKMIKLGFWVALAAFALITWIIVEAKTNDR